MEPDMPVEERLGIGDIAELLFTRQLASTGGSLFAQFGRKAFHQCQIGIGLLFDQRRINRVMLLEGAKERVIIKPRRNVDGRFDRDRDFDDISIVDFDRDFGVE